MAITHDPPWAQGSSKQLIGSATVVMATGVVTATGVVMVTGVVVMTMDDVYSKVVADGAMVAMKMSEHNHHVNV